MARELEGAAGRELKRLPHLRTLSADNGRMKKSVCILLACVSIPAWSQGWKLPVFTVRYEAAGGAAEDPDEETFLASSLRNTLSLQMKETADEAAFGLMLTFSGKDSYQPADRSGDYSYFKLIQDGTIRVNDAWKLGYDLGVKAMDYLSLDSKGLSKDVAHDERRRHRVPAGGQGHERRGRVQRPLRGRDESGGFPRRRG